MKNRPLPAIYSVTAVGPLLEEVQHLYGLAGPVYGRLLRAWVNDVYEVTTPNGHFVLKVYRDQWRSAEEVAWEAELQAHLGAHGLGVAPIIPVHDGQLTAAVQTPEGERPITLSRYVEGAKPDHPLPPNFYSQFGQLGAAVHQISDGFSSPHPRPQLDRAALIDEPLATVRPWFEHRPADWAFLSTLGDVLRQKLDDLISQGMDWGICQGDFSLDNVHIVEDGRLVLHDFDHAAYSWRALDLYGVQVSKRGNWDAFLQGYTAVRSLSEADLAAGPYIWATSYLRMMAGEIRLWAEWVGTLRITGWIEDELAALHSWSDTCL